MSENRSVLRRFYAFEVGDEEAILKKIVFVLVGGWLEFSRGDDTSHNGYCCTNPNLKSEIDKSVLRESIRQEPRFSSN